MNVSPSIFYNKQQNHLNLWWQGTIILSALIIINFIIFLFDQRLLADEMLWAKPLKFEISIIIHFTTLTVLASLLSPEKRNGIVWKSMTYAVVTAGLFEVLYIFLQAARGRESHFNNATAVESIMYGLMGLFAVILVIGSFYLGCLLYRKYLSERNSVLLLSAAFGLTIGSVLTLIIAGYLSSGPSGYSVDVNNQEIMRLPIVSWYLNGEDLRIPHFFATHMMQLIPLYGFWLTQKNISIAVAKARLFWSTVIYTLLVLLLFAIAVF